MSDEPANWEGMGYPTQSTEYSNWPNDMVNYNKGGTPDALASDMLPTLHIRCINMMNLIVSTQHNGNPNMQDSNISHQN